MCLLTVKYKEAETKTSQKEESHQILDIQSLI